LLALTAGVLSAAFPPGVQIISSGAV